jgi:hypothetical protein
MTMHIVYYKGEGGGFQGLALVIFFYDMLLSSYFIRRFCLGRGEFCESVFACD